MALPPEIGDGCAIPEGDRTDEDCILKYGGINNEDHLVDGHIGLIGVDHPAGGGDKTIVIIDCCIDEIFCLLPIEGQRCGRG